MLSGYYSLREKERKISDREKRKWVAERMGKRERKGMADRKIYDRKTEKR